MIPRLKPALSWKEIWAAFAFWRKVTVQDFEYTFAKTLGSQYALAFPYGRTGLMFAIHALGIKDKEIICPAYTCVVVAHAIVLSGNIPVFVDSKRDSFNMDFELVNQAINENTGAIIATSIFGEAVDCDAVKKIQLDYPKIKIIQDCAHSFGAKWNDSFVQKVGDCAIYGLNISKIMTSIFGGMVTMDDEDLYLHLKQLRDTELSWIAQIHPLHKTKSHMYLKQYFLKKCGNITKSLKYLCYLLAVWVGFNRYIYGFLNSLERLGLLNRFVKYYDENKIDMPLDYLNNMTKIQARVGIVQCEKYQKIIEHRQKIAAIYFEGLKNTSDIILPPNNAGDTFSHFVVRMKNADAFIKHCRQQGIQLGALIDYHIPSMPTYKKHQYYSHQLSETWPGNVVNLPVHLGVSEVDAEKIIKLFQLDS